MTKGELILRSLPRRADVQRLKTFVSQVELTRIRNRSPRTQAAQVDDDDQGTARDYKTTRVNLVSPHLQTGAPAEPAI